MAICLKLVLMKNILQQQKQRQRNKLQLFSNEMKKVKRLKKALVPKDRQFRLSNVNAKPLWHTLTWLTW